MNIPERLVGKTVELEFYDGESTTGRIIELHEEFVCLQDNEEQNLHYLSLERICAIHVAKGEV